MSNNKLSVEDICHVIRLTLSWYLTGLDPSAAGHTTTVETGERDRGRAEEWRHSPMVTCTLVSGQEIGDMGRGR